MCTSAFGGEKALSTFRESEDVERRCAALAQDWQQQVLVLVLMMSEM